MRVALRPSIPHQQRPIHITWHAQQRAIERLGLSTSEAQGHLEGLYRSSIALPYRFGRSFERKWNPFRRRRKGAVQYRVSGGVLLLCHGRSVITVWHLNQEQEATVVWWALAGVWVQA